MFEQKFMRSTSTLARPTTGSRRRNRAAENIVHAFSAILAIGSVAFAAYMISANAASNAQDEFHAAFVQPAEAGYASANAYQAYSAAEANIEVVPGRFYWASGSAQFGRSNATQPRSERLALLLEQREQ